MTNNTKLDEAIEALSNLIYINRHEHPNPTKHLKTALSILQKVRDKELVEPKSRGWIYQKLLQLDTALFDYPMDYMKIASALVGEVATPRLTEEGLEMIIKNSEAWNWLTGEEEDYNEAKKMLKELAHSLMKYIRGGDK